MTSGTREGAARALCGHGTACATVSEGRCWDCHLIYLREGGQGLRADRLEMMKREHGRGTLIEALEGPIMDVLIAEFVRRYDEESPLVRRGASLRRNGRPTW